MSRGTTIIRATLDDVPAIAPLFAAYRAFYGKPAGEVERAEVFVRERLERGEAVVFTARTPGMAQSNAAGFTLLYPQFTSVGTARVWHLNDLFVAPPCRRLGVAKALMLHAIAFARQDGAVRLTLETQASNAGARALYESLGMTLGTEFVKYAMRFE
jgi:ribosomal protein S18 acetylase RimI-like enzyme